MFVPIPPDPGKMIGYLLVCSKQFPANIFIHKCNVISDKTFSDFFHDIFCVSTLNVTLIWINKGKPETDIIVFDMIQPLLALLRFLFRDGHFPLYKVQIDQRLQCPRKIRRPDADRRRKICHFRVSKSDRTQNRKITAKFRHLLLKQKIRLLVQIP